MKYWRPPFHTDLFRKHLESQHSSQWREYQLLTRSDKKTFFDNKLEFKDTLKTFLQTDNSLPITFTIDSNIVEDIIGDMFFHPEDQGCLTQERVLNLFQKSNDDEYTVTFKKTAQFLNVVDCIAQGLSFRQVQGITTSNKKWFRSTNMSITSDTDASNIARQICAINLQVLSSLLNSDSVWAFSLANDASTHREKSYFDNQIRFCLDGNLYNFHAISIPMFS